MKEIDDALNVPSSIEVFKDRRKSTPLMLPEDKDKEYIRSNIIDVIEKGGDALEELIEVARASEHPRAYEVVATLMRTILEANKHLRDANEEERKAKAPSESPVNNNVILTTEAFLDMIREKNSNG